MAGVQITARVVHAGGAQEAPAPVVVAAKSATTAAPASVPAVPADPPPLETQEVLDVPLRFADGKVQLAGRPARVDLGTPTRLPRFDGRFIARLYDGQRALLDVVRFDFPLLGDAYVPEGAPTSIMTQVSDNLSTRVVVRLPWDSQLDAIEITDQKTGKWIVVSASYDGEAGAAGGTQGTEDLQGGFGYDASQPASQP
jgi:hypothetical protein